MKKETNKQRHNHRNRERIKRGRNKEQIKQPRKAQKRNTETNKKETQHQKAKQNQH